MTVKWRNRKLLRERKKVDKKSMTGKGDLEEQVRKMERLAKTGKRLEKFKKCHFLTA